jgi:hypothetical protein
VIQARYGADIENGDEHVIMCLLRGEKKIEDGFVIFVASWLYTWGSSKYSMPLNSFQYVRSLSW